MSKGRHHDDAEHRPAGDDPRLEIGWEAGRAGSPYTFEGGQGRAWNIIGSLTSRDPVFRKRMQRRYQIMYAPFLIMYVVLFVVLIVRAIA